VCDSPVSPANGSYMTSADGMSVTFSCDPGTSLQGDVTLTCDLDGTGWLGQRPVCSMFITKVYITIVQDMCVLKHI